MVANTCESSANKANGLRLFLHFLEIALGNGCEQLADSCEYLQMLENVKRT